MGAECGGLGEKWALMVERHIYRGEDTFASTRRACEVGWNTFPFLEAKVLMISQ